MSKDALIIFIKNSGEVKSRIAKEVGKEKAIAIYDELLDHAFLLAMEVKKTAAIYLYFTEKNEESRWDKITSNQFVQIDGDLGARMEVALSKVLLHHDKAVLIGSDCPYITPELINESFTKLSIVDAVIGPANDGGYYLVGLNKPQDNIFKGIAWSTTEVYNTTVDKLYEARLSFATLNRLSDIDYYKDYQQWTSQI